MVDLAIIAAGEGMRLKNEGINVSKPMVKVNRIPLIERIINIAVDYGIKSVNCIINENSKDLEEYLTDKNFSVPVNLIVKSTESSLHSLYELSKIITAPFLLTTTDSIFLKDEFNSFLDAALNKDIADGVFAVTDFIDDEKPLYVAVDDNLRITGFYDENNRFNFVTGGLYFFRRNIKNEVKEAVDNGVVRLRNFQRFLIKKEYRIYAYPFSKIIDVDHATDIEKAENFLMKNTEKI
jgi:NDP-sugar pyrophosphorylase family protein